MSKIEQIINEIESYLDECKPQPFSNNRKIVVEKDVIDEMLVELRVQTPEEIKKYQKIIANRDALIADAQSKARSIIDDANKQADIIVSEHEITKKANEQAQEIVNEAQNAANDIVSKANSEASQIREGAISYTDNELKMLQNLLSSTLLDTESKYNSFVSQLNGTLEVVSQNRGALSGVAAEVAEPKTSIDIAL